MPRKHNVIIVGNGLFGSLAATLARYNGHNVTVVSNQHPNAASLASGCVLAPSWLNSMDKEQIATSMTVLEEHTKVIPLGLTSNILNKEVKVKRVALDSILIKPDRVAEVQQVHNGRVVLADGTTLQGTVLVAAGVWSSQLLGGLPGMRGLWGASLRIKAQLDVPGRIHVYAPYRQAVAFNNTPKEVWMGDGTSLIEGTWKAHEKERINATMDRAKELFGLPIAPGTKIHVGVRPYVEGHKAGYFKQVDSKLWVSTGGAKNGTVLAAWQAHRFVTEALR